MRTVYKYEIPASGEIYAPENAKPVLFAMQEHRPHVWLDCETTSAKEHYRFLIVPTGGHVPYDMQHVQSLQDGPYIWHLYWKAP